MLLPRTLIWSTESGFWPFGVIFTFRMCVFIAISTPALRPIKNQIRRHTDGTH